MTRNVTSSRDLPAAVKTTDRARSGAAGTRRQLARRVRTIVFHFLCATRTTPPFEILSGISPGSFCFQLYNFFVSHLTLQRRKFSKEWWVELCAFKWECFKCCDYV
uniref:(northern house mosquito) hypothetical protein n=1 Tax=Culex pipiens TaxID=7175 RepID=A0A8D8JL55_CULPI